MASLRDFSLFKNNSLITNLVNSGYYFGGTFLQFLIAIFTQPIFSEYLELKDFATIGYFSAIQALLFPLFNMSLPFFYLSNYWRHGSNSDRSSELSFILNFLNISNGIISIISFFIVSIYFKISNVIFPLFPFILIVFGNLFLEKFKIYYLLECRIQKKGLNYFLINVIQIILNNGFSLYFVIALNGGAIGRMGGMLVGVFITSIISIVLLTLSKKYRISFKLEWSKINIALRYCFPLIIGAYAYYPIGNIDSLLLERIGNVTEFGYYNIGLTIAGFVGTFFLAVYQSFEPDLYKLLTLKRHRTYIKYVLVFIAFMLIFTILFLFVSDSLVSYLTAGRFTKASQYANYFIISILFMQIGGVFEQIFTSYGVTKLAMLRNILMGLICIFLYKYMIDSYQFNGAKVSRIISSVLYLIIGLLLVVAYFYQHKLKRKLKFFLK